MKIKQIDLNKNCGIYKITSPTGKIYIGQSKDIKRRLKNYIKLHCKYQKVLYRSIKKHGWESHQFDIIEYCSEEDLNCSERFWQDEFDVLGEKGLNCVLQTCGEIKKEIHPRMKKEIANTLSKNGVGENNPMWGKKHTAEAKKMMSDKRKGIYFGDKNPMWGRRGELNPQYGKKLTEEHLAKVLPTLIKNYESQKKKVIDLLTNIIYSSVGEASEKLGINKNTLRSKLNGNLRNNTTLLYYEEYERDINI